MKNSTSIAYNYLNLPTAYTGGYTYENSSLKFINHAEGYIEPDGGGNYSYVYQYKDHLDNIRLSYSDSNGDGVVDISELIEESNYYPFGLQHEGYNSVVNGTHYPYTFNGMEEQEELDLNWLDFGARNYDAALGRWMNIDPLAEEMTRLSPYTFAFNNPIYFIDPDGMMPIGLGQMDEEKNFDFSNIDGPNYIASTVVDETGTIIDYKDDGDDNIYLNTRSENNIIGKESEGSEYIVGQKIYGGDIFDNADLPDNFYVAINPNGPNQNKIDPIGGTGILEFVGPAGILKWKSVLNLLRSLTFKNGTKWVFGTFKSKAKWASQLTKRGWTKKQITEAIRKGQKFKAVNNVNKGNSATRYVHPTTGKSVVDDVTKEVLHIGGAGFKY